MSLSTIPIPKYLTEYSSDFTGRFVFSFRDFDQDGESFSFAFGREVNLGSQGNALCDQHDNSYVEVLKNAIREAIGVSYTLWDNESENMHSIVKLVSPEDYEIIPLNREEFLDLEQILRRAFIALGAVDMDDPNYR